MNIIEIQSKVGKHENGVTPFSTGSQYYDWLHANCERCAKGPVWSEVEMGQENTKCDIEQALSEGTITGHVTEEIARRMGFFDSRGKYIWVCPEAEWTKE